MTRGDAGNAFGTDLPAHASEAFGAPRHKRRWWSRGSSQPAPRASTAYRDTSQYRRSPYQQTAAPPVVARTPTTSADPIGQALRMFDQWAQTMNKRG